MNPEVTVRIQHAAEGEGLPLPGYATEGAAGMDLLAAVEEDVVIRPRERRLVSTGIRIELPPGYEAQVRPRSGLALRHGVTLVNSPGTIDADYRGVVGVVMINHGSEPFTVHRGDRIAQMVIAAVTRFRWKAVDELESTSRAEGGFGHTGV